MESLNIQKILVPVDFSEASLNALQTAVAMSKRHQAALVLVHIINPDSVLVFQEGGLIFDIGTDDYINRMSQKLEHLAEQTQSDTEQPCTGLVQSGATVESIVKTAEEEGVDIIVMGAHEVSGLREFLIGTTAYSILKHAHCPVLTVPAEGRWIDFTKIIFPVRPVISALNKYCFSRTIIQKNRAELIIMGVLEYFGKHAVTPLEEETNQLVNLVRRDGIRLKRDFYYCSSIAQTILEKARVFQADLLIVTANLEVQLKDFFTGSFARQIVNHAALPVLLIRPSLSLSTPKTAASETFSVLER
ncbi:MAG: universal stress protein [Spirosomataceae bacterium]